MKLNRLWLSCSIHQPGRVFMKVPSKIGALSLHKFTKFMQLLFFSYMWQIAKEG